jgi:hypothetical protein
MTIPDFLLMVEVLDGKLQSQMSRNPDLVNKCRKRSDKILIEFSKAPEAWQLVFQVL